MAVRVALVVLGACSFQPHAANDGGTPGDDAHDAAPDAFEGPPGSYCLGDATVTICLDAQPSAVVTISADTDVDTETSPLCATNVVGGSTACVLAGTSISVTAKLTAHGGRPLVLMSSGTITVTGAIDIAAHIDGNPQATGAAGDASCAGATPPTGVGGGYGGSFGALGATGGGDGSGGLGGLPPTADPTPATLRGGCAGFGPTGGGTVGHSGGAVALLAMTSIEIDGAIDASGGGGGGAPSGGHGGGGGGSGGMIVIDAPAVNGATGAKIFANGGGGGEGSAGGTGHPGNDAPADPTMAATGGTGGSQDGGDGGSGSKGDGLNANTAAKGGAGNADGGGGGGGGGPGVIQLFKASALPGTVSPPTS